MHWLYNSSFVPHPQPLTLHSYSTSSMIHPTCKPFFEQPEVIDCKSWARDWCYRSNQLSNGSKLLAFYRHHSTKIAKLQHPTSAELIAPICKPFFELPEVVDWKSWARVWCCRSNQLSNGSKLTALYRHHSTKTCRVTAPYFCWINCSHL